jgi:hypothetical protein
MYDRELRRDCSGSWTLMVIAMSDRRLRDLERRWRETGAHDDEARWLAERVRAGDLSTARLCLATYCGRAGARLASRDERRDHQRVPEDPRFWLHGALTFVPDSRRHLAVLGVTAACRTLLPRWEEQNPGDPRLRCVVDAAERWLSGPTPSNRDVLRSAAAAAEDVYLSCRLSRIASATARLDRVVGSDDDWARERVPGEVGFALQHLTEAGAEARLALSAMRDALAAWALA